MSDTGTAVRRLTDGVAEEVRALLARRRIRDIELARRIGKSHTYVGRRLNGETTFDLDDLELIASVLGVSVVDLFPRSRREVTVTDLVSPIGALPNPLIPPQRGPKSSVDKSPVRRGSHYVRPNEPCGARR